MRVGIDVTPLLDERPTGIGVCTRLILEAARAAGHEVVGLVAGWRGADPGKKLGLKVRRNWVPRVLNPIFLDVFQWPKVETLLGRVDVYIATNFVMPPSRGARTIAIVHDLGRLKHPNLFGSRQVLRFQFQARRCGNYADTIVTPTQAVADEVVDLKIAEKERVRVVPWFARPFPEGGTLPALMKDIGPFVLSVATQERRKNLPFLIRAFARAAGRIPHHLALCGGPGTDTEAVEAAVEAAVGGNAGDRIHLLGHASSEELAALYRAADLVLCPSLYEGFGLPVLEAMSLSCPVLASDIPVHREVGGDAVRFAPAADEEGFAAALVALAGDAAAREQLRRAGLRRAGGFSEARTRQGLAELLSPRSDP